MSGGWTRFFSKKRLQNRPKTSPTILTNMEKENFNQLIIKQFEGTWNATGKLPEPNFELEMDTEFARLKNRIAVDGAEKTGRIVELNSRRNWLRYAAAAAVLGFLSISVWQFLGEKNEQVLAGNDASKSEITLEDGSHIFINKQSKLAYPEHFSGKNRLVQLTGEAFFEIAKDATKPFIIETEVAKIRVVGTKFNVKSAADRCEIFVEEGHVIVENNGQKSDLTAGMGVVVFKNGAKFQPVSRPNAAAWAHDELRFDNALLVDVLADLSSFYDVKITTDDAGLQNGRFTWSKPVDGKLETVLEIITETFTARVERVSEKEFRLVKK